MEENGRNELKQSENKGNWPFSTKLGKTRQTSRPEVVNYFCQLADTTVLAAGISTPAIGKATKFSFFSILRLDNLVDSVYDLLSYIRMSKTHPKFILKEEKHIIKEIIKRKRSSCSQDPDFLEYFCNCY